MVTQILLLCAFCLLFSSFIYYYFNFVCFVYLIAYLLLLISCFIICRVSYCSDFITNYVSMFLHYSVSLLGWFFSCLCWFISLLCFNCCFTHNLNVVTCFYFLLFYLGCLVVFCLLAYFYWDISLFWCNYYLKFFSNVVAHFDFMFLNSGSFTADDSSAAYSLVLTVLFLCNYYNLRCFLNMVIYFGLLFTHLVFQLVLCSVTYPYRIISLLCNFINELNLYIYKVVWYTVAVIYCVHTVNIDMFGIIFALKRRGGALYRRWNMGEFSGVLGLIGFGDVIKWKTQESQFTDCITLFLHGCVGCTYWVLDVNVLVVSTVCYGCSVLVLASLYTKVWW